MNYNREPTRRQWVLGWLYIGVYLAVLITAAACENTGQPAPPEASPCIVFDDIPADVEWTWFHSKRFARGWPDTTRTDTVYVVRGEGMRP